MRNKSIIFCVIAIAAAALFTNCSKESETLFEGAPEKVYVQVDLGTTKTYMGASSAGVHKMYWSNGDKIAINGTASEELTGLADDTPIATFAFTNAPVAPYNVVYPASIYTDASHVTLPAIQSWKDGNFADGMNPMAGYNATGTGNITLHHLCAILKISVKRGTSAPVDEDNLVAVRFKGRNSEQVCGSFSIDYENAALTGASSAAADKEVRVTKVIATSTSEAAVFYIVVPAQTYSSGFDVIVQDQNGHIMTKSVNVSKELEAGHLYNMDEFEFVPTATELGVVITSAQDLIDFATAYNNKEYDSLGDALVATLSNDIAFDATSSAAFNATGGIGLKNGVNGTEDYYFNGLLNGANHEISGLTATVPLFCATGSSGIIKDLTIADDCTFTFTQPNDADHYFGSVVGYHKGLLDNVVAQSDVALAAVEDVAYLTSIGGLIGRSTTGATQFCSYSGNISVPDGFTSTKKILVGGLVGYSSNTGAISDSGFDGTISFEGKDVRTDDDSGKGADKYTPYHVIGGIVGYNGGGATISNCAVTDHPTVPGAGSYSTTVATIVNKSVKTYNTAIGGIVGHNVKGTVSSCTNAAFIFNSIFKDSNSDWSGRYLRTGGIVGYNSANGVVVDCINNGAISHRSNPRLQSVGGVVAYNASNGTVTGCTNNADLAIMTSGVGSYSARLPYFGGVIGENFSTEVSDLHNTGDLAISRTENATGTEVRMGGVIGNNMAAIDGGSTKNITNTGQVYFNTNISNQSLKYSFGGIVGYSEASVSNVVNSGYVLVNWASDAYVASLVHMGGVVGYMKSGDDPLTLSGCQNIGGESNAGEVYLNVKKGSAGHTNNYAGGVLGYISGNINISNCTNSGYVHGGNATKVNGKTLFVGGIAAYVAGVSSISECTNTGRLLNDQFNNNVTKGNATYEGGIAGAVIGTDEHHITISDVTNTVSGIGPRRGYSGGAVGYAEYTDITNASNTGDYVGGSGYYLGGIVGWAVNSTVTGSTYNGSAIQTSQLIQGGGIVALLDEGSTIDDCSSHIETIDKNGTAIEPYGGIAGSSVAGTVIKNCHYKSTIQICGDSNFTDNGEANANDL